MADFIVIVIVAAALIAAIVSCIKAKKSGVNLSCGEKCSDCRGGCGGCRQSGQKKK